MNERIIEEIETYIIQWRDNYKKYQLESFLYEIEKLTEIIRRIKIKDFQYLSVEEALHIDTRLSNSYDRNICDDIITK